MQLTMLERLKISRKWIPFSDVIYKNVSLSSLIDDGTFFLYKKIIEEKFER